MVEAIGASQAPPNASTLRELAELQLVVMAIEQAINDKQDASFMRSFEKLDAA